LPWTLANEDNWNKTHRFGGRIFSIGRLIMIAAGAASPEVASGALFLTIALVILVPSIYSWRLSLQEKSKTSP